jgi:DNA polymerase elongation subunit (family B)
MTPKVLLFDIETMSNKAYVWGKYEQDVIAYIEEGYMLSWSAKWLGGKQITKGLCSYPNYKPGPDDRKLVEDLHKLISEADIVIAHNGDRFDVKKMNTRFIFHGLTPPEPYKTVDTLKVAKRHFAFNSNKLDDLGDFLKVGRKVKHPGFELWLGCERGDQKSWDLMLKYNKQDVILLEQVYLKLRPWIRGHENVARDEVSCPKCNSKKLQSRGTGWSSGIEYQRYQCSDCGGWAKGKSKRIQKPLVSL